MNPNEQFSYCSAMGGAKGRFCRGSLWALGYGISNILMASVQVECFLLFFFIFFQINGVSR